MAGYAASVAKVLSAGVRGAVQGEIARVGEQRRVAVVVAVVVVPVAMMAAVSSTPETLEHVLEETHLSLLNEWTKR